MQSTESQLLALGATVRDMFREQWRQVGRESGALPAGDAAVPEPELEALAPELDIVRAPVEPPAPPAEAPHRPADALAVEAGSRITPVLQSSVRNTLVGVRVVDDAGIVVASTRGELGMSLASIEEVRTALAGRRASALRARASDQGTVPLRSISRGQRYRVFVALPVIEQGRVIGAVLLSRTPLDTAKALYLKRGPLLVVVLVVLGAVVLVSTVTAVMIGRPIRALTRQAERAAAGERRAMSELRAAGTDELARLSRSVAQMADTLERREQYIRDFAAQVSHEFKTPLTTIRGTLELLQDHGDEMSDEERRRFLGNLQDASNRLERLVRRLLELARPTCCAPPTTAATFSESSPRPSISSASPACGSSSSCRPTSALPGSRPRPWRRCWRTSWTTPASTPAQP
ncbi:MAG: HAMP domain-containing protein [Acidobacteria bacterium]|nr:HAMP domain-containing protein [Acidobacteriota bacterium]